MAHPIPHPMANGIRDRQRQRQRNENDRGNANVSHPVIANRSADRRARGGLSRAEGERIKRACRNEIARLTAQGTDPDEVVHLAVHRVFARMNADRERRRRELAAYHAAEAQRLAG